MADDFKLHTFSFIWTAVSVFCSCLFWCAEPLVCQQGSYTHCSLFHSSQLTWSVPSILLVVCSAKCRDLRIVFFRSNRISNRIGRPIRFRIESSNRISRIYHASRNTAWRSAGVPYRPIICWRLALWTNESDVRNWVFVHFNSVLKRVKQCRCTLI